MAYIKPKATKWRKGAPPAIGWWPASLFRDYCVLRWWDGKRWSQEQPMRLSKKELPIRNGALPLAHYYDEDIEWTDRWWE
jgi:hypothetical protein